MYNKVCQCANQFWWCGQQYQVSALCVSDLGLIDYSSSSTILLRQDPKGRREGQEVFFSTNSFYLSKSNYFSYVHNALLFCLTGHCCISCLHPNYKEDWKPTYIIWVASILVGGSPGKGENRADFHVFICACHRKRRVCVFSYREH